MPQPNDRRRATRTRFGSLADLLYPEDALQDPAYGDEKPHFTFGEQDDGGDSPITLLSQSDKASKMYPDGAQGKDKAGGNISESDTANSGKSDLTIRPQKQPNDGTNTLGSPDDSNCFKPEDDVDRAAKIARTKGSPDQMGPFEYAGKFYPAMAKGAASVFADIFNGSKDATTFLLNLSGANGGDAQNKARDQLGDFVDGTRAGGKAAYDGLKVYYTNPEIRDAVNAAIEKHAPEMWEKIKEGGGALIGDPEKAGRLSGKVILSGGIKAAPEAGAALSGSMTAATKAEAAAPFFLKKLALIGNLDTTGKDVRSKVEGIIFRSDYANRNRDTQ